MDILFWIILIVIVVAALLWLLNRNRSAGRQGASGTRTDGALERGSAGASAEAAATTGIPTAAGFGSPAEPAAPVTAEEPADSSAAAPAETPAAGGQDAPDRAPAGGQDGQRLQDEAEWETQWSEAGTPAPRSASGADGDTPVPAAAAAAAAAHVPGSASTEGAASTDGAGGAAPREADSPEPEAAARPVHHDEYTGPHAPTLPGAETAAVEDSPAAGAPEDTRAPEHGPSGHPADEPVAETDPHRQAAAAETLDRAESSALVEEAAGHHREPAAEPGAMAGEPGGHLAAEEPYGAGSASPAADGSGPADYGVKGDAAAMVYYEEGHPDYEQARAEVWFESAAHAEAAGFRAPRRKRL